MKLPGQNLEVEPVTGSKVGELVRNAYASPREVIARARAVLAAGKSSAK